VSAFPGSTSAADVEAVFAAAPDDRAELLRTIDALVTANAPSLSRHATQLAANKPAIGYGPFHYRYASGREGDTYYLTLANQAAHVSFYVLCADGDGYLAERRAGSLGKVSVGKSCIRIKKLAHIDLDELSALIAEAERAGLPVTMPE
jgi:hypothetical protein